MGKRLRMVNMRRRLAVATCNSGASAVEFAIVLPVLLLLMFGTFQIAMLMFSYNVMVSTARDTVRAMAVCTITDLATATTTAQNSLNVEIPWVNKWTITPSIGSDVEMTISVDPAKAAVLSYLPFSLNPLTAHVQMLKEPLSAGAGSC